MKKSIKSLTENFECPLINALFLSNGDMLVLESQFGGVPSIRVLCKSSVDSFFQYNEADYVISFDFHKEYENDHYKVSVGEGSFGGDGVIRLSRKDTGKLVWFLFLDNSNPFNFVKIENNTVIAKSTSNISIEIPISNPEQITVEISEKTSK